MPRFPVIFALRVRLRARGPPLWRYARLKRALDSRMAVAHPPMPPPTAIGADGVPRSPAPRPPPRSRTVALTAILRVAGDARSTSGWLARCAVHAVNCSRRASRAERSPAARPAPLAQPLGLARRRQGMGRWGYLLPRPCARLDVGQPMRLRRADCGRALAPRNPRAPAWLRRPLTLG